MLFQDSGVGTPATLKVDQHGFYLYWVDQNHEMDLLDIATIRDTRTGRYAKIPKVSVCIIYLINSIKILPCAKISQNI